MSLPIISSVNWAGEATGEGVRVVEVKLAGLSMSLPIIPSMNIPGGKSGDIEVAEESGMKPPSEFLPPSLIP
jgi:hypothetical protein